MSDIRPLGTSDSLDIKYVEATASPSVSGFTPVYITIPVGIKKIKYLSFMQMLSSVTTQYVFDGILVRGGFDGSLPSSATYKANSIDLVKQILERTSSGLGVNKIAVCYFTNTRWTNVFISAETENSITFKFEAMNIHSSEINNIFRVYYA